MPKHFPNTACFMMILHCLGEPMSQLMQAGSRVVSGGVVVVVVEKSTFPGRVSGAVNRFLTRIRFNFDCCGLLSHRRCLAFSQLHFIILHTSKKGSFPLLHFPKVGFSNRSFCWTNSSIAYLHSANTDTDLMALTYSYHPTKSTHGQLMSKR